MSSLNITQPVFYLISGLAADERIFANLDLKGKVVYLPWLSPEKGEQLEAYAARMANGIIPQQKAIIAGVSFGGMVALEIARTRPWLKVVQISSVCKRSQMPVLFKVLRWLPLYRLMPAQLLRHFTSFGQWFFGTRGRTERRLFRAILKDADPWLMQWSIDQLIQWQPAEAYPCLQIIGTLDTVFPARYFDKAIKIKGGTHLLVYTQAKQVSQILNTAAEEWK